MDGHLWHGRWLQAFQGLVSVHLGHAMALNSPDHQPQALRAFFTEVPRCLAPLQLEALSIVVNDGVDKLMGSNTL